MTLVKGQPWNIITIINTWRLIRYTHSQPWGLQISYINRKSGFLSTWWLVRYPHSQPWQVKVAKPKNSSIIYSKRISQRLGLETKDSRITRLHRPSSSHPDAGVWVLVWRAAKGRTGCTPFLPSSLGALVVGQSFSIMRTHIHVRMSCKAEMIKNHYLSLVYSRFALINWPPLLSHERPPENPIYS